MKSITAVPFEEASFHRRSLEFSSPRTFWPVTGTFPTKQPTDRWPGCIHLRCVDTLYQRSYTAHLNKSQLPLVEKAIETAGLMLGTDKLRGYCLKIKIPVSYPQ